MNIPKGTAKVIFRRANELYLRNIPLWLKISFLFWVVFAVGQFAYLDNGILLMKLNQLGGLFFSGIDVLFTGIIFLVFCVVLMATMIVFEQVEQKKSMSKLFSLYRISVKMLPSLLVLKVMYLWRAFWKLFLLIVPGVFALADGVAYSCAFFYDQKQGQGALDFSDRLVRINRNRYWDYLLIGFLVALMLLVPFIIFLDQVAYVFNLKDLPVFESVFQGLKYVGAYMAVVYCLAFHYSVYQTFKSFLASGENP